MDRLRLIAVTLQLPSHAAAVCVYMRDVCYIGIFDENQARLIDISCVYIYAREWRGISRADSDERGYNAW